MKKIIAFLICVLMCLKGGVNEITVVETNENLSLDDKRVVCSKRNSELIALNGLLEEYYLLYEQNPLDERVVELITKTESMIDFLESQDIQENRSIIGDGITNELPPQLTYATATSLVISAITTFSTGGFKLSAELLTVAFNNTDTSRNYTPIYGGRIVSSNAAREKAYDTKVSDELKFEFDMSKSLNENDMALSIHGTYYTKPNSSSKVIMISDRYNFDGFEGQDNEILNFANGIFSIIQALGVVKEYTVNISVDFSMDLDVRVQSFNTNAYIISVTNNSFQRQLIIYNKKMCQIEDARNWTNLTDISYFYLDSGCSKSVVISENGTATSVAFSFVISGLRYISSAYQLSVGGTLSKELTIANHYSYYGIDIVGKDGNEWVLKYTNQSSYDVLLDYNYKMCNINDAENWTNLIYQTSMIVGANSEGLFKIEENGLAGSIAIRYKKGSYYYYFYANFLSVETTMSANCRIEYCYEYLLLDNEGKSNGKWKIMIHNPKSYDLIVYYNSKMCFQSDAVNWINLKDVESVVIPANGSTEVGIATNGTAGFITTSYIDNGYRIITCANGLSAAGAITQRNNAISL